MFHVLNEFMRIIVTNFHGLTRIARIAWIILFCVFKYDLGGSEQVA